MVGGVLINLRQVAQENPKHNLQLLDTLKLSLSHLRKVLFFFVKGSVNSNILLLFIFLIILRKVYAFRFLSALSLALTVLLALVGFVVVFAVRLLFALLLALVTLLAFVLLALALVVTLGREGAFLTGMIAQRTLYAPCADGLMSNK